MSYGLRRCEQSYNSVVAPKANCEKTFPGRLSRNHSPVQSPNVLKYFRSEDRTISSTLSCFDEEVGRLLSLTVAPVTLADASQCDVRRSTFNGRRSAHPSAVFRFRSSPNLFVPKSYSSSTSCSYSDFLRLEEGSVDLPLAGAQKRLTQGANFRDSGVT
jgi:hypothetical protein